MIKEIRHVGIVVKNLKKSLHFYQNVLGFKKFDEGIVVKKDAVNFYKMEYEVKWVKLRLGAGTMLELYNIIDVQSRFAYAYENSPMGFSLNHIALTVDDINKYHKLLDKHGRCLCRIKESNNHMVFFARDPDENLIEFVQPPNRKK